MNTLHVNITLARYSDWAFTSAVVALVVALLLLAFELAYVGGRRADSRASVLVGAHQNVGADSTTPGVVADAAARPFDERVGRAGLAVVYLGVGLLLTCVVLRGLATMRVPWGNMYEFINLTCLSALVAGTIVLRRPQYRPLWVFLLLPVLVLLTVSGRWLYTNAAPVMPALQSYWLPIHVSVVSLGSGVFLVAGIASILFLLRTSRLGEPDNPANARQPAGAHGAAFARRADPGPDRLPDHDLRVSRVRIRGNFRGDLGRRSRAGTGGGIPRRPYRSSHGRCMRPISMPGRPRDGETGKQHGSTSRDSWRWSSICSSLTWSLWACIPMRAWADRPRATDPDTHNKGECTCPTIRQPARQARRARDLEQRQPRGDHPTTPCRPTHRIRRLGR